MAALDFPANPSLNQKYTGDNGVTYVWTGTYWAAPGGGDDVYVRVAGDNMTGNLTIGGDTKFKATTDGTLTLATALTVGTTSTVGRLRVSGDGTSNPLILAQDSQNNSQQVFSGTDSLGNETSAIMTDGSSTFAGSLIVGEFDDGQTADKTGVRIGNFTNN